MALEGKMGVIKYLLFSFNLLFWLSGLALIVIGAFLKVQYGDYLTFADNDYADAALFLIAVGVIVFVIAFLGCCGAIRENYCMITTFAVLLIIIFVLEITAGALGFAYRKKVEGIVEEALDRGLRTGNYHREKGTEKFYDWMQTEFRCCGNNGRSDWGLFVPDSCKTYVVGCKHKVENFVQKNLALIGGVGLGFALVQVLGIAFACCLMRKMRGEFDDA